MKELAGKTVCVTGASRGLGLGMAQHFLAQGMNVVVCARTCPELGGDPARILAMSADVTDAASIQTLVLKAEERFGTIDLWINNAGILGPIDMMRHVDSEAFLKHLTINIQGVFHGSKAYVNHLHQRKKAGGILINISSGAARSAYEGWSAYCAGKSAVDRFTEVVALEEHPIELRAYSLAPGIIDTDMQSTIRATSADRFPGVEKFLDLKTNNAFSSTEFVSKKILELCFDPSHRPSEVCIGLPLESDPPR